MKTQTSKTNQGTAWKTVGDTDFLYYERTGKVLGSVRPFHVEHNGSLYAAEFEDDRSLGLYVNQLYAQAAVTEAASLSITKRTTKRV